MQAIGRQPQRAPDGTPVHYERHRPEQTTLYRLVQQHAATFFAQIWRILGGLGFSVQKPERRAIERDEDAVRSWKRSTWPALKKKPSERAD